MRVDTADKPAHITTEIIQNLVNADLVIADLSALNANVFYELGIRHAYQRPCILLSDWELRPPFDVAGINTIKYVYDDPNSHTEAARRIREQIAAFQEKTNVSNPVTVALGFGKLSESGDSKERLIALMADQIEQIQNDVRSLKSERSIEKVANALIARDIQNNALRSVGRNALADLFVDSTPTEEPHGSLGDILAEHLRNNANK